MPIAVFYISPSSHSRRLCKLCALLIDAVYTDDGGQYFLHVDTCHLFECRCYAVNERLNTTSLHRGWSLDVNAGILLFYCSLSTVFYIMSSRPTVKINGTHRRKVVNSVDQC